LPFAVNFLIRPGYVISFWLNNWKGKGMYQPLRERSGSVGFAGVRSNTVVLDWRLPGRLLFSALVFAIALPLALLQCSWRGLLYCWQALLRLSLAALIWAVLALLALLLVMLLCIQFSTAAMG
jgi:hypothetical protein